MKGTQLSSIPAFLRLNSSMFIANLPKKVGVKLELEKPKTNVSLHSLFTPGTGNTATYFGRRVNEFKERMGLLGRSCQISSATCVTDEVDSSTDICVVLLMRPTCIS